MPAAQFDYGQLVERALRRVVHDALAIGRRARPARPPSFLHHLPHRPSGRRPRRRVARALSERDDGRAPARVLGPRGRPGRLRGHPELQAVAQRIEIPVRGGPGVRRPERRVRPPVHGRRRDRPRPGRQAPPAPVAELPVPEGPSRPERRPATGAERPTTPAAPRSSPWTASARSSGQPLSRAEATGEAVRRSACSAVDRGTGAGP